MSGIYSTTNADGGLRTTLRFSLFDRRPGGGAAHDRSIAYPTQEEALTTDDTNVRLFSPPELPPTPGYSHVADVTGGRTIHVSGQVALDRSGGVVGEGDLETQARRVFENIEVALGAAGATFSDVVKLGFYLTDISRMGVVRAVRDEYVDTDRPPASTAVEVRRLIRDEFLIEIEAVAVARS